MVCFGWPGSPNHVLGVSKSVSSGPCLCIIYFWQYCFQKFLWETLIAVRIYKKLLYVETRYNINSLLAWAVFGAARVDKICLFDFILAFLRVHDGSSASMATTCVVNLVLLSVNFQLLWPSATANYGSRRPQIESLWPLKCCGLWPQQKVAAEGRKSGY